FGDGIHEVFRGDDVFSVATIDCVARERGIVTEIFRAGTTVLARTVGMVQPSDAYTSARLEFAGAGAERVYDADDLMTWEERRLAWPKHTFNDMEISATHATVSDANEDFAWSGLRSGDLDEGERVGFDRSGRVENAGFHVNGKRALDDSATFLDGQASRRLLLVENTCAPDGCFHIRSDVLGDEAQHVPVQCSLHDDLDLIDAY